MLGKLPITETMKEKPAQRTIDDVEVKKPDGCGGTYEENFFVDRKK